MEGMKAGWLLTLAAALLCLTGCTGDKTGQGPVLSDKQKQFISQGLAGMRDGVELLAFVDGSPASAKVKSFTAEVAALQGKVAYQSYDIEKDRATAEAFGVNRAPVVVLKKGATARMRFFGLPDGYEFPVFIESISRLSRDAPDISAAGVAKLAGLKVPVTFKVFTTPS